MMKNILFYGDSNTWGFDPETCGRYDYEERWTTICARALGEGYHCIPAGMNGRTTIFDDPWKGCRNGIQGLDFELQSHKPLDLLVVMLGTNDLKFTDAQGSAAGMEHLIRMVLTANDRYALSSPVFPSGAKILLISPVLVLGSIGRMTADIGAEPAASADVDVRLDEVAEAVKLGALYRKIADRYGLYFLDAAKLTEPSCIDGVHLSREGHAVLGQAVARRVREMRR